MIRRLGLGLSVSFLAVLAGMLTAWAIGTHAEPLVQEIRTSPTPAYDFEYEYPPAAGSSEEDDCVNFLRDAGYWDSSCYFVTTNATDAVTLASITEELLANDSPEVAIVEFQRRYHDWYTRGPQAKIYCFDRKTVALSALDGELDKAELLGKIDYCHIAVYKDSLPLWPLGR